jgi:hypothetical protein
MSLLLRDEPPATEVNDMLPVEGHWLDRHFRINERLYPYHSGAASRCGIEAFRLRINEIDFALNQIMVRNAKGQKDRLTMLPGRFTLMNTAIFHAKS